MDKVFKPEFNFVVTYGLLGVFFIIFFILSFYTLSLGKNGKIGVSEAVITSAFLCFISCAMVFFIGIYHTISYEFHKESIILKCGPFKSKIQYEDIKKVTIVDNLGFSPAGFRLPTYLLTKCYFKEYGWLTMYATGYRNVVIIETDKKRYGITPKNIEEFISTLNEKLK